MKILQHLGTRVYGNKKATLNFVLCQCEQCRETFEKPLSIVLKTPDSKCRKCSKTKHGKSKNDKIYYAWMNMKTRVNNPNYEMFENYGGAGVKICDEWVNNFEAFYDWAIKNGHRDYLSIDRINVYGNYEPSNCRWTTKNVQAQNTRLLSKRNTSGYRGVRFRKDNKKWQARICINSKVISIGHFDTDVECAKAFDLYVIENKLSHPLNFPEILSQEP